VTDQEDFFSRGHLRLLNFVGWAKFLAWTALVVHILWAIGIYAQEQSYFLYYRSFGEQIQDRDFIDLLRQAPSFAFGIFIEIIGVLLRGIVYFFVLKGISLGLSMVVETDINYRDQEGEANE
jgi:hypothetical protein